jgi:hypothetical protein
VCSLWPQCGHLETTQAVTLKSGSSMTLLQFLNLPGYGENCIRKISCFSVRVGACCTGLPVGSPIKENPGELGFQSAASDGHRHTPRGHNLNYTIWTLYAESVSSNQAPFTQGPAPFTKGRAPFPINQANLGMPFSQGCALLKGACTLSYQPGKLGHALLTRARPPKKGCPASQVKRRPSATGLLLRTHSDGPVSQTCLLRLLRRELLRTVTLDDSTPQRRISELRVWSYEPFIVFAPSSSGYTSGKNLEVLYIPITETIKTYHEIMRFISRN